jgi:hypothetical protein
LKKKKVIIFQSQSPITAVKIAKNVLSVLKVLPAQNGLSRQTACKG